MKNQKWIDVRPWGWFIRIFNLPFVWVKFIKVNGGHRTSLQSHKFRDELHISFRFIKRGQIHRMGDGVHFEVAFGKPDENDIIRYADDYGRK